MWFFEMLKGGRKWGSLNNSTGKTKGMEGQTWGGTRARKVERKEGERKGINAREGAAKGGLQKRSKEGNKREVES